MQTHFEKMHFTVKISYKISYNLVTLPKNTNFRHFFRKMLDDFRKVRYNKNSENNVELLSLVLLSPFFCSTYVFRRWCISSGNFFDFLCNLQKRKQQGCTKFGVSPAVCFFGLFQNEKLAIVNITVPTPQLLDCRGLPAMCFYIPNPRQGILPDRCHDS